MNVESLTDSDVRNVRGGLRGGQAISARRCLRFFIALLVPAIAASSSVVSAQAITFTKIVDTNTLIPGGSGNFDNLRNSNAYPAISNGNVVFWGQGAAAEGIYLYTPGSGLSVVADASTAVPGGTGNFVHFYGPDISGNNIVFNGDNNGIYTSDGSTIDVVADTHTQIPDSAANFALFGLLPSIDGTNVAFRGQGGGADGVHTSIGGVLSRVADKTTAIPGGSGMFTAFVDPDLDGTSVAVVGIGSGQQGIYTDFGGALAVVQDRDSPIPSTTVTEDFTFFYSVTTSGGIVTFRGADNQTGSSRRFGVYQAAAGSVVAIADWDTPIPSGSFNFRNFGEISSSGGAVAFYGRHSSTSTPQGGIYTDLGGSLINVINLGSMVDGETVKDEFDTNPQIGRSALSGNEIVFFVEFDGGSEAIYVATIGCSGDINGTDGADALAGTGASETICGREDDDVITGDGGDDTIDGGTGIDTAVFSGPFCNYTVSAGDPVTVTDDVGTDGADSLTSVEFLEFSDGVIDVNAVPGRGGCDDDDDGLSNDDEAFYGTDPNDPDSDDDGLFDGTEVDSAMGTGCPDPLDNDSDDDTLLDGDEVNLGTNPCSIDSDGDGVNDDADPLPTEPGVTSGFLEDETRELSEEGGPIDLGEFTGPNNNAVEGRRNALSNRATEAANLIAAGDFDGAIDKLSSLLDKIDGLSPPPDWMDDSPEKTALADEVKLLIDLLVLL